MRKNFKRSKFLERIGFRYILNHRTNEVHRVDRLTNRCGINFMTDAGYAMRPYVWFMMIKWGAGDPSKCYDGCKHCWPDKHWK